ncbi:MAG TPA: V-type ATPase 116kDa subunit family protein, partial [Spirochaetia bacterium]
MSAVEIIGPSDLFPSAVESIQAAGVLHIVETPLAEYGKADLLSKIHLTADQAQQRETCAQTAAAMDELLAEVPAPLQKSIAGSLALREWYDQLSAAELDALAARARVLGSRTRSFRRRERNLTDDIASLSSYESILTLFAPLVETHELPRGFEMIGVVFEKRNRLARNMLKKEIRNLTSDRFAFIEQPLDGGRTGVLIGFPPIHAARVRSFIATAGIGDLAFPRHLRDKPFEEAFASLKEELVGLTRARRELRASMDAFFEENAAEMVALHHLVHDRLSRYDALPKFARTRHAFIVQGWMPGDAVDALRGSLSRSSDGATVVREVPERTLGIPPVRLENPRPISSFEPLLMLMPLPKYGTIDPTKYLATFFPPIFGLMLADVGYGAIVLAAAAVLWLTGRDRKIQRRLALVAASCGFFTVVFGLVFGELFGEIGASLGLHPLWQERFSLENGRSATTLLGYLMVALAVGVLQVFFGLVLGVVNARRVRDTSMALGNLARIAGLVFLFFVVGRLARVLPSSLTSVGVISLILFLVFMVLQTIRHPSHGIMIPIEILSAMGNILSYARIMAIGLSSVVLSLLASMLGGMAGNVVVAVLVFVLVNALNLVLGIIDPTIQGMRLQYVEFFSKFYLGGGRPFSPFRKTGGVVS